MDFRTEKGDAINPFSGLAITVPGSAALWEDLVKTHGKLSLMEVLQPAIELAETGFTLGPITAQLWAEGTLQGDEARKVFLPGGISPKAGQILTNRDLGSTFRLLAEKGAKEGFYRGRIADAIVAASNEYGGVLTLSDLEDHCTVKANPISAVYKGIRIFQLPPPTQGLATLIALKLFEKVDDDALRDDAHDLRCGAMYLNTLLNFTSLGAAFIPPLCLLPEPRRCDGSFGDRMHASGIQRCSDVHSRPVLGFSPCG